MERDAEVEAEVETEEAGLELQPAHRAEALDVLAQIELRFALVREGLYDEKMEELAMEGALILQGMLFRVKRNTMLMMKPRASSRDDTFAERTADPS